MEIEAIAICNEMKTSKYIFLAGAAICMLLNATGCITDRNEEYSCDMQQTTLSFAIQHSGTVPAPKASGENPGIDNMRGLFVDRILVNFYRRNLSDGPYPDDAAGFVLYQTQTLKCQDKEIDGFRYAKGNVRLAEGYEYRATAIGYSEEKKESSLFSFSGKDFGSAHVSLADEVQYTTPELFFGTVRYGGNFEDNEAGDVVFTYDKRSGKELTGWLYRCVAGVELNLTEVPEDVTGIALLAEKVNTSSKAGDYSDFNNASDTQTVPKGEELEKFRLMEWTRPAEGAVSADVSLQGGSLLPVISRLTVRIIRKDKVEAIPLCMKNPSSGTGIIPEDDPAQGILAFYRNHYYRIGGSFQELISQDALLSVTVNPDWEGDADLSLDGK